MSAATSTPTPGQADPWQVITDVMSELLRGGQTADIRCRAALGVLASAGIDFDGNPVAIAGQEPPAAEVEAAFAGGMRVRTAPCTVEAHDHEHFQVRTNRHWLCGHLLASVLAVQGIVAAARPQPAPELAEIDPDKLDLISAWFDLDDARRGRTGPPEVQADLRRWATLVRGIRERAGLPS